MDESGSSQASLKTNTSSIVCSVNRGANVTFPNNKATAKDTAASSNGARYAHNQKHPLPIRQPMSRNPSLKATRKTTESSPGIYIKTATASHSGGRKPSLKLNIHSQAATSTATTKKNRLSNVVWSHSVLCQLVVLLLQQRIAFAKPGQGAPLDQQRRHDASDEDDACADDFEFCHSRLLGANPVIGAAPAQLRVLHANHDALVLRSIDRSTLRDDPGFIHLHRARQTACREDGPMFQQVQVPVDQCGKSLFGGL